MKTVSIELDKERNLKLTNNGICYIDERTGLNLYEGKDIFDFSTKNIAILLFGLLLHEDEDLTEKQVGNMVGPENIAYVSGRINALVEAITPKPSKKEHILGLTDKKKSKAEREPGTEDRPQ